MIFLMQSLISKVTSTSPAIPAPVRYKSSQSACVGCTATPKGISSEISKSRGFRSDPVIHICTNEHVEWLLNYELWILLEKWQTSVESHLVKHIYTHTHAYIHTYINEHLARLSNYEIWILLEKLIQKSCLRIEFRHCKGFKIYMNEHVEWLLNCELWILVEKLIQKTCLRIGFRHWEG